MREKKVIWNKLDRKQVSFIVKTISEQKGGLQLIQT